MALHCVTVGIGIGTGTDTTLDLRCECPVAINADYGRDGGARRRRSSWSPPAPSTGRGILIHNARTGQPLAGSEIPERKLEDEAPKAKIWPATPEELGCNRLLKTHHNLLRLPLPESAFISAIAIIHLHGVCARINNEKPSPLLPILSTAQPIMRPTAWMNRPTDDPAGSVETAGMGHGVARQSNSPLLAVKILRLPSPLRRRSC